MIITKKKNSTCIISRNTCKKLVEHQLRTNGSSNGSLLKMLYQSESRRNKHFVLTSIQEMIRRLYGLLSHELR